MGFLPLGLESAPQGLDLNTVELFARFFSIEELITRLHIQDLDAPQLTLLKAALLQELARNVAPQSAVWTAVRERVQAVARQLPGPSAA
jgi:hypothetical protein